MSVRARHWLNKRISVRLVIRGVTGQQIFMCLIGKDYQHGLQTNVILTIPFLLSIFSFHSFIQAVSIAPLQVHYYSGAPDTACIYCAGIHAEAPQATGSEELAQGPYVAARAGFEPATLWTKSV